MSFPLRRVLRRLLVLSRDTPAGEEAASARKKGSFGLRYLLSVISFRALGTFFFFFNDTRSPRGAIM